jgi:hypothetical protein
MPLLIEEEKRPVPWFPILIGLLILGSIAAGTYYLFFAEKPGIEVVLPPALRSADEISALEIEPSEVINSNQFRSLRSYTGLPTTGELGKANPFAP